MLIIERETIERLLDFPSLIAALRNGFVAFHAGKAWVAPITNIALPERNGEMHIKPGYLLDSPEICVKVVTCFYDNPRHGLPTRDGAILLADRNDGRMKALLADKGLITDMRTAGASAVAVDVLAVRRPVRLGLVGAGTQAYWHAAAIACVRDVEEVIVWGRDASKAGAAAGNIESRLGLTARAGRLDEAALADVIVTATPAQEPILTTQSLLPHALIVAMGADAAGKRELGPKILCSARAIVADSLVQCRRYGEMQWLGPQATNDAICEMGALLAGADTLPPGEGPVIFDSTGVAFQDAVGGELVLRKVEAERARRKLDT